MELKIAFLYKCTCVVCSCYEETTNFIQLRIIFSHITRRDIICYTSINKRQLKLHSNKPMWAYQISFE